MYHRGRGSFKDRDHTVVRTDSNPRCKFSFYTWGVFTVKVLIKDLEGGEVLLKHRLNYADDVQDAAKSRKFKIKK